MANEAILLFETALPIPFTVANAGGIEKGAAVALIDPMSVSGATASTDVAGGFTGAEKIASNGETKIDVYREGIFKIRLSGSVNVGDPLTVTDVSPNCFVKYDIGDTVSGSRVWGTALETGTAGESIKMELKPMMGAEA